MEISHFHPHTSGHVPTSLIFCLHNKYLPLSIHKGMCDPLKRKIQYHVQTLTFWKKALSISKDLINYMALSFFHFFYKKSLILSTLIFHYIISSMHIHKGDPLLHNITTFNIPFGSITFSYKLNPDNTIFHYHHHRSFLSPYLLHCEPHCCLLLLP